MLVKIQKLTKELSKERRQDGTKPKNVKEERETEDLLSEMRGQLQSLSQQNSTLRSKVHFFKTLHEAEQRKRTPYSHIPPRINFGKRKTKEEPEYEHLEEPVQNNELQELVNQLRQKLTETEEQLKIHEESSLRYQQEKEELEKQHAVDLLSIQHENYALKKQLVDLNQKHDELDEKHRTQSKLYKEMMASAEQLGLDLKQERQLNLDLTDQLTKIKSENEAQQELGVIIQDLQNEKQMLADELQKLLDSKFGQGRDEEYQLQISTLKKKLAELQDSQSQYLQEKIGLHDAIEKLKQELLRLEQAKQLSDTERFEIQDRLERLLSKFKLFEGFELLDLEEAFNLWQLKKHAGVTIEAIENMDTLQQERDKLQQLKKQYAECCQDLEKTMKLLKLQESINHGYKQEIQQLNQKMRLIQNEYEFRLEEFSRLADMRGHKIQLLEKQLKDSFSLPPPELLVKEPPKKQLQNGQNTISITLSSAILHEEPIKQLHLEQDSQLITFLTVDFFDFETACSPLGLGRKPVYDYQAQFTVVVDDFLMDHMLSRTVQLTLYKAVGLEFHSIGYCHLALNELLTNQLSASYILDLLTNNHKPLGKIECSISIEISMPLAIQAFHERQAALKLLDAFPKDDKIDKKLHQNPRNANTLSIHVKQAVFGNQLAEGTPSILGCIHWEDLFRDIVIPPKQSYHPDFDFVFSIPLHMSTDLDRILRKGKLTMVFVDDVQEHTYGYCKVPLHDLSQGRAISETLDIQDAHGIKAGSIGIELHWERPYQVEEATVVSILDSEAIKQEFQSIEEIIVPSQSTERQETVITSHTNDGPETVIERQDTAVTSSVTDRQETATQETKMVDSTEAQATKDTDDNTIPDTFHLTVQQIHFDLENPKVKEIIDPVKQAFVGYEFLHFPLASLESQSLVMNHQTIVVDFERHFTREELQVPENLEMLQDMHQKRKDLILTIVDEPVPSEEGPVGECQDIALVRVPLEEILQQERIQAQIWSLDKQVLMGHMDLSVEGSALLSHLLSK
ncbi:hypothetical protein EDD86DRAFT_204412 [Gorgonomyces haynaldii]|nr:hypothetical protein EDD86DRAFT_204412 [Gorgonomyces haynaldii]